MELQERAKRILISKENVFSRGELDQGHTTTIKHDIVLTDPVPFKERYRRIAPQLYDDVKKHLEEMLRVGAIAKSYSPWASAVVLAKRKDGGLRFCLDLRKLNNRTVKDAYTLPRIEETLDSLAGARIFTALDLKAGYWQVELTERAREYTAFTVGPLGFYECVRMPFGLTNAPATFQRLMESCLGDLHLQSVLIYLDDIIVFSTNPHDHLDSLEKVLDKLEENGLKLKPSKCKFFQTTLEYLGHTVTADGIRASRSRINEVLNWRTPRTVTEVRKFLGLASYYRRFIKDFAKIAAPLYAEIGTKDGEKRGTISKHQGRKMKIQWSPECEEAFNRLKKEITTAPLLAYPDFTKEFVLKIDASFTGLGAVLYQEHDGVMRVVAFGSRGLRKPERTYPAYRLEFLGLKWAVTQRFKEYLYGGKFRIFTDSNPLTYITSTGKTDATTQRWVAELASYDFDLIYKPGKGNVEADALSRMPWPEEEDQEVVVLRSEGVQAVFDQALCPMAAVRSLGVAPEVISEEDEEEALAVDPSGWERWQISDAVLERASEALRAGTFLSPIGENSPTSQRGGTKGDTPSEKNPPSETKLAKWTKEQNREWQILKTMGPSIQRREATRGVNLLYRRKQVEDRTTWQLLVPKEKRYELLRRAHDEMGHLGRDKTLGILADRVYWPKMKEDVENHIASCERCQRYKKAPDVAPLQPYTAQYPMELVHLDFLKVEVNPDRYRNILVCTDHFTGYAQAYLTPDETARTTAKFFIEEFCTQYGLPEKILTDQGRNFTGHLMNEICKLLRVEKLRTTPYHPQTNGQCERFNRTLMSMLGTLDKEEKAHWPKLLKTLVRCYNATKNRMTGYSPHCLMFGYEPRLPLDVDLGLPAPGSWLKGGNKTAYVKRLKKHLEWGFSAAREARKYEAEKAKVRYDERIRGGALEPGDEVLVRINQYPGKHKIADKWEEERYTVLERLTEVVYRVEPVGGGRTRVLHRNHLLPLVYRRLKSGSEQTDREKECTPPTSSEDETTNEPTDDPNSKEAPKKARRRRGKKKKTPEVTEPRVTRSKTKGKPDLLVTAL